MSRSALVMMFIMLLANWGGFLYLLAWAVRKEKGRHAG